MKLKTLKTHIENDLANDFIKFFNFLAEVFIFFDEKLNMSLQLCVNY